MGLKVIEDARSKIFARVGLVNWTMDTWDVASTKLEKVDGGLMDISTFLHIERLEMQAILRGQKHGLEKVRDRQAAWASSGTDLQALERHIDVLLDQWVAHEGRVVDPPVSDEYVSPARAQQPLIEVSRQFSTLRTLASMMCMVVEEEIRDWCVEGQWKAGSNESVKRTLDMVGCSCRLMWPYLISNLYSSSTCRESDAA